jgi:rhamnogalacturonyl hydrolase YesR
MQPNSFDLDAALQALLAHPASPWRLDACGVTRAASAIPALLHPHAYVPTTSSARVVLVGGLSGRGDDTRLACQALEAYINAGASRLGTIALSAVPCANPDGLRFQVAPENGAGGNPSLGYPPAGHFYDDAHNPEQRYLWRWIGLQAPDLVLEIQAGERVVWRASSAAASLGTAMQATDMSPDDTLVAALGKGQPNGLGAIPGVCLSTPPEALAGQLERLWGILERPSSSSARQALETRRARTPRAIAHLLASVYGHTLDPVVYTQGMAIEGRLWLHRLDPAGPDPLPEIVQLVEPYVSGAKAMFDDNAAAHLLAGITWALDLAEMTGDQRYADLLISVAERYRPGVDGGAPPPSDPDFRTEDMCMNGALLGRAFRLTGRTRYVDLLTTFLLDASTQQADGLFWHSRSAPYYWGRGNGFAALGFCETLTYLPVDYPSRQALVATHVRHLNALLHRQHASGMFPQVLDVPGSYLEFTATCMIGYAIARGLRLGWLDGSYRPALALAWQGVTERIDDTGGVVDACTNTGVQRSVRDYLDRPAIFGRDDRSGAMALWFAIEMMRLQGDAQYTE